LGGRWDLGSCIFCSSDGGPPEGKGEVSAVKRRLRCGRGSCRRPGPFDGACGAILGMGGGGCGGAKKEGLTGGEGGCVTVLRKRETAGLRRCRKIHPRANCDGRARAVRLGVRLIRGPEGRCWRVGVPTGGEGYVEDRVLRRASGGVVGPRRLSRVRRASSVLWLEVKAVLSRFW